LRRHLVALALLSALLCPVRSFAADASSTCSLGIVNANWDHGVEFTAYSVFQYLDPAQCSVCPAPRAVQITALKLLLCGTNNTVQFTVTPVAAVGAPGSLVPDPAQTLGPSQTFTAVISCSGGLLGLRTIALPSAIPVDRACFLRIKIKDLGSPTGFAALTATNVNACAAPGYTFVSWPEGQPVQDACGVFGGNIPMWLSATCDAVVGARSGAWGALKIRYR
jgi:hypothetical protein